MNVKKYLILDEKGNHEYDLMVSEENQETTLSLYHSNGDQWTEYTKGTLAMEMLDDGNGVKFSKKLKKLDYSELAYVKILVNLSSELEKYKDSFIAVRVNDNETIKL